MAEGSHAEGSHIGRPRSWIAVGVIMVGCVLGGVGLVAGPSWPLFWAGLAVAAIGGVLALAVGIFSDVVVYTPRDIALGADVATGTAGVSTSVEGAETHTEKTETDAAASAQNAENLASG